MDVGEEARGRARALVFWVKLAKKAGFRTLSVAVDVQSGRRAAEGFVEIGGELRKFLPLRQDFFPPPPPLPRCPIRAGGGGGVSARGFNSSMIGILQFKDPI